MLGEQTQLLGGNTHPGDNAEILRAFSLEKKKEKGVKVGGASAQVLQGSEVLPILFVPRAVAGNWGKYHLQ